MAAGMKWLAMVLLGGVLVSAWAATIPSPDEVTRRSEDAALNRLNGALLALRDADGAYREFVRADSLLPLLPDEPGIRVSLSPALNDAQRDTLVQTIADEAAYVDTIRARVGVFVIDREYGSLPGIAPSGVPSEERELYAGTDAAGTYCAMVATGDVRSGVMRAHSFSIMQNSMRGRRVGASILGPCTFVARYGAPGPRIEQWLRAGAYRMAEVSRTNKAAAGIDVGQRWEDRILTGGDLRMRGCAGGRLDQCRAVMLNPTWGDAEIDGTPAIDLGRGFRYAASPYALLMRDLETTFGTGRFADFWGSDENVDTAFASAFGIDVGTWVQGWGRTTYGSLRLGPGLDMRALMFWGMTMLVLGAVALVIAQRRSI